jgi:hypothetical protein
MKENKDREEDDDGPDYRFEAIGRGRMQAEGDSE